MSSTARQEAGSSRRPSSSSSSSSSSSPPPLSSPPLWHTLSPLSPRWSFVSGASVADTTSTSTSTSTSTIMPAAPFHLPFSRQPRDSSSHSPSPLPSPSPRDSVVSATSASTSSSVALRRFWSPSSSSPSSPATSAQTQTQTRPPLWLPPIQQPRFFSRQLQPRPRITFIPPLVDATAGTAPAPQLLLPALRADLCWLGCHLLGFLADVLLSPSSAAAAAAANPVEAALHIGLAVGGAAVLLWAPLLFACLPAALFVGWLAACASCARLASAPLNAALPAMFRSPWSSVEGEEEHIDQAEDDERWFFVSGIGTSSRSLAATLPRLAAVFGRPITLIRAGRSYGVAADILRALLHRLHRRLPFLPAAPGTEALYAAVRRALQSSPSSSSSKPPRRVVILAHNVGAIAVSQVLARLLADVPSAWLARFEIYTFGSLAPDFVLPARFPLHGLPSSSSTSAVAPHVEHFALADDPCARFGILRTIRDHLSTRYCGGVFVLAEPPWPQTSTSPLGLSPSPCHRARIRHRSTSASSWFTGTCSAESEDACLPRYCMGGGRRRYSPFRMEDYLTALFGPEPWSMRPDIAGRGTADDGLLDAVIAVDRDLAERREMHALTLSTMCYPVRREEGQGQGDGEREGHTEKQQEERRHGSCRSSALPPEASPSPSLLASRLSWTGLGATAALNATTRNMRHSDADRPQKWQAHQGAQGLHELQGLEAARQLCRDYDGRPGREVTLLAGHHAEAVMRHEEHYGTYGIT